MTNIDTPGNEEKRNELLDDRDDVITAVDPSEFAFRTQTLALIRYLVDIKQVPAERFRQAARELGLAAGIAEARSAAADNPDQRLVVDHQAVAAVLIHTFLKFHLVVDDAHNAQELES